MTTKKFTWTLFAYIVLFQNVEAQFSQEKTIARCETCEPTGVHAADIDGDGNQDMLVASYYDNKIFWYKNDGTGSFSNQKLITDQAFGAFFVTAADLDQDGDQDVISTTYTDNQVSWYRNLGSGNFSKEIVIASNVQRGPFVSTGDLDGDGDLDILVQGVGWFKNDGKGNFSNANELYQSTGKSYAIDLDGDKDLDILTDGRYDRVLSWSENTGLGVFSPFKLFARLHSSVISKPVDFDKDGDIDIVFLSNNGFGWYRNQGKGKFSDFIMLSNKSEIAGLELEVIDVDNDGDFDFLTRSHSEIAWFENLGQEGISAKISLKIATGFINDISCLDVNKDGLTDFIASYSDDQVVWFKNEGKGLYSEKIITYSPTNEAWTLFLSDLDQDGRKDVVFGARHARTIGWYKNGKGARFDSLSTITNNYEGLTSLHVSDVDKDGDADVLITSASSDRVEWFSNKGSGKFELGKNIGSQGFALSHVVVADISGDDKGDIIASQIYGGGISFNKYVERDSFQPTEKLSFPIGGGLDNFFVADINNDEKLDIVGAGNQSINLFCLKNTGDGQFEYNQVSYVSGVTSVFADHLDADEWRDIVFTTKEANEVVFCKNNGKSFSPQRIIATLNSPAEFVTGNDLDGDLDVDLLVAAGKEIIYLENDGNGNFLQFVLSKEFDGARAVMAADLDLDGDLDVVALSRFDDKIAWFENQSNHPTISGMSFWDENTNGKFEDKEYVIKHLPINLNPNGTRAFPRNDGRFQFYVPEGKYQLSAVPSVCWQLTTDSLVYHLNIDGSAAIKRDFGFKLVSQVSNVQSRMYSSPTRCSVKVPFVLAVENKGCTPSKGMYGIVKSPLVIYHGTAPDKIKGDTLLWDYSRLLAGETQQINIAFQILGADFIGDTIQMTTLAYIENNLGRLQLANTFAYRSVIRCAYDPNDKLTFPNRRSVYPRNYTLFKEEMEFLVRFQNTGNDTAFTVVIRDTLDKNLDWSSFRPLVGSHPFETHIQENGAVSFTFKNILLPDSKTNEPLSHGFVSYRVSPKAGLPEQTEILNTAYIYFDFNPPIQTNTTSNVMVSSLPRVTRTKDINYSLDYKLYPNPFDDELLLEMAPIKGRGDYTFSLLNSQGQIVQLKKVIANIEQINTQHLPSGLYFYLIKNAQGRVVASGKVVCR